jgi:glycosyltransferase involved in cell wall biosynthesis
LIIKKVQDVGMTIVFDLAATQPLGNNVHGGGEYGKVVFKSLLADSPHNSIAAFYDRHRPIDQVLFERAQTCGVDLIEISRHSDIQKIISSKKIGTFYSALPYRYYDIDFHDMKVVFTIHGLRAIEMPSDRYEPKYAKGISDWAKWAAKSVFKNQYVRWRTSQFGRLLNRPTGQVHIVVPSEHTKNSLLIAFPDLKAAEITVLYSPVTSIGGELTPEPSTLTTYGLSERGFIMLVSGNRWVKNSYRALMALDELTTKTDIGKQVIIVGGAPQRLPKNWRNNFNFLPYVDQAELVALYKSAYCLLYPTLNEGFGYPPLEAMRHGTPVICSAITSTTEILGDAPMYCSPYSTAEIQNRIIGLIHSNQLWETKSNQSIDRYNFVSSRQRAMLNKLCQIIAT